MTKKEYYLIGFVLLLVGVYAVSFTDWFKPKVIRIEYSSRGLRTGGAAATSSKAELGNVTFALNRTYHLTSVKVVPLQEYLTNKYVTPIWEESSKAGSTPTDGFAFGLDIPGMTNIRPYLTTEALQPGVEYRLLVLAGRAKGERDFKVNNVNLGRR